MQTKQKFFYGWIITAICFIVVYFTVGVVVTAFSATSMYIIEEWNITQSQNGFLVTLRTLVSVVAMYLCGIYYKKLSLRVGLVLGLGMGIVGYILLALGRGMISGSAAMIFTGACHGFAGMFAISLYAERWFLKKRGLMLAIVTAASGFTTMTMPPLLVKIVEEISLSAAFWFVAALLVVVLIIVALFAKDSPASVGQVRLGEGSEGDKSKRVVTEKYNPATIHCVLLMIASFMIGGMCYTQGQVRTLNLTTVGWTTAEAASALSLYGLFLIIGKLIYGPITDRVSQRKCGWLFYLLIMVSHIIYAWAPLPFFNNTLVIINEILYSLGGPVCTIGLALYGMEMAKNGDTVKWVRNYLVAYNVGALALTPLAGVSADATGNYSLAFYGMAACALIGLICSQIAYSGAYRRQRQMDN